jgi:hypothetical protein
MVEASDPSTSFVSIEHDTTRAHSSAVLFSDRANVHVVEGDWTQLRERGPFDLLVRDGGGKGKEPQDDPPLDPTAGWLTLGGTIVLDDFLPAEHPDAVAHDEARRYWIEHPALLVTELRLSATLATLVGRRTR